MRTLVRLAESRTICVALFGAIAALAIAWYRVEASLRAPEIPGYRWTAHPNVLLICDRPDCGCTLTAAEWAAKGLQRNMDVLVVTRRPVPDIEPLRKGRPGQRVSVYITRDTSLIDRLTPSGRTTAAVVKSGRFVRSFTARADIGGLLGGGPR